MISGVLSPFTVLCIDRYQTPPECASAFLTTEGVTCNQRAIHEEKIKATLVKHLLLYGAGRQNTPQYSRMAARRMLAEIKIISTTRTFRETRVRSPCFWHCKVLINCTK